MIRDPSHSFDEQRLAIDHLRMEIEQERLELDKQFFRKYAIPIVAVALCVAVGIFGLFQVRVASINRSAESALEHHRATFQLKLDLIKEFSTAFHRAAHTYHSLWLRIEWLGLEMAKAPPKRDQRKINAWRNESQALRADFLKAEPLEGALFKISAFYTLPEIKELCSEFLDEWKGFNRTYDEMLKKSYNEPDHLSQGDVEASQTEREKIEARLDLLRGRLLILMYKELGESD